MSGYLFVHLYVYLSAYLSVYLSAKLPVCQCVCFPLREAAEQHAVFGGGASSAELHLACRVLTAEGSVPAHWLVTLSASKLAGDCGCSPSQSQAPLLPAKSGTHTSVFNKDNHPPHLCLHLPLQVQVCTNDSDHI